MSVTRELSSTSEGLELTTKGIWNVAPPSECKDVACLKVHPGGQLQFLAYNFGRHPGLTFSIWFKPISTSSNNSKIFDFSDSAAQYGILLGQHAATDQVLFGVTNAGIEWQWKSPAGLWSAGVWRHIVWTLTPALSMAERPTWAIYFDGVLWTTFISGYPAETELSFNYLGNDRAASGQFVGYLDSLYIFPEVMGDHEAKSLFKVSINQV
jgi:hypothetical protein